jgi:site-specific recombinase XerD
MQVQLNSNLPIPFAPSIQFKKALYSFIEKQNSDLTKKAYFSAIIQFYESAPLKDYQACEQTHIVFYLNWLKERYATASVAQKITILRSWHQWLHQCELIEKDPSRYIKAPPQDALFGKTEELSDKEVKQLLQMPNRNTKAGLRDKIILDLFFHTGMRLESLRKLKVSSLSYERGYHILSIIIKGGKIHRIPIIKGSIVHDLKEHININSLSDNDFLFRPYKNKFKRYDQCLSPVAIQNIFKKYAKQASIKTRISPHSARVTVISHCSERGSTEIEIQNLTAHRSSTSIRRYNRRREQIENSAAHKISY